MGREILLFGILCFSLRVVYGCQLQGVAPGLARVIVNIWDYERGDVYENQVISITDVVNIVQSGVNSGPYISGRLEGTTFYLTTTASYELYENVETLDTFALTAQFRCLDGTTITQVFQVNVQDTNNHSPEFLPTGEYDIAIATPLLPGHQITGCQHNIVVRDIDLTTYRIDFGLTGSDLFEIEYDEASSTTAKEFVAVLRTTTFIRTLSETVELTISATDVDETGNDPRTTYATVRITADSDAELPEEPVFSQPLYTATYTENDNIVLDDIIALQQGYNEQVEFSLNEEYRLYFGIIRNGNVLSLNVTNPLSEDILTRHQIYLVIRADREFTSGATATIVVQLPDEIHLQFERSIYEGIIEDNTLDLPNIILSEGYKDTSVSISVSNEYFSADIQGNEITLTMEPLSQVIIDENTYLNLELVARTDRSVATAMVTLEIIKNDSTTPLFQNPVYIGSYNIDDNVILDPIEIIQGFDDTVVVELDGEHSGHFELIRNGAISKLSVRDTLPLEVLGEQTIILTIHATKFRTIGAAASIYITLPEEIKLEFERGSYEGTIADNTLELPSIILTQGYENYEVFVDVLNEFFAASIQNNNLITLTMMEQLAEDVIKANSFLNLVVTATTSRSSASTIVTLEIIKNDTTTPQFHSALYSGTYSTSGELILDQIHIVQGYDESVEVTLDGEHVSLFQLIRNEASSTVTVDAIPPAIFRERNIALTVTATKPRTVGATAVINIALPTDRLLEFEEINYKGSYQNGNLTVESLVLITGYDGTVDFNIDGEHKQYFEVSNNLYQVSIEMIEPLPNSVVLENSFLQLVVIASGINALPATASLTIEIIKDDVSTPLFGQNIYSIAYDSENIELNNINIIQGFDSTVSFRLDGDDSRYFSLSEVSNGVTLSLQEDIPEDVIFNKKTLIFSVLAEKPLTVGSHTTIVITFPPELTNIAVMRFSQNTYIGSLDGGVLNLNPIILGTGYKQDTEFLLTGDYYSYFTLYDTNEVVTITTSDLTLPQEVVENNKFIVLEVEARRERAESVFTSVVIEIIHEVETVETPIFNAAYYRGNYNLEEGLQFTDPIHLVQGYDYSVSFDLQGDYSEHFSVSDDKNVITLSANDVPVNVWENNHQLILTIVASKPEVINVTSALVIDMSKDIYHNVTVLEFERTSYIGSIENDIVTIQPITLTEGYTEDVVFTLIGDLESFFAYTRDEATIILRLDGTIPEESIPTNRIIVLGIQASTPTDSLPAVTTVILEVIKDDTSPEVENLVFAQTYYVGTYNATTGVALENPISLSEGFNDTVQFNLDGDSSTYFSIAQDENSVTLTVRETIPPAVIANNNQLIFVINAQSANGATAQATVVILLPNEVDEDMPVLGFERTSYVGSIENDIVTIQPITLTEGYTEDVVFTLIGDLESFFAYTRDEATIILRLDDTIPEESIPTNGIIVLGIQASTPTDSLPAVTTVILEVIRDDKSTEVENLVFAQTYYVGTYNATTGVALENPISLSEGFNDTVQFNLDGDSSTYFSIAQDENSVTLTVRETIPPAVIANNNQLIFVINAQSANGASAQATVVILLPNEVDEDMPVLGFERTSYVGSIENDIVTIQPITLTEGYTEDVIFTLIGDLESFFAYTRDEATIILRLDGTIPEESIPTNGIIVLGVQASTPTDSLPAVTTVVLEVIRDDKSTEVENLVFAQTYYVGTYNATTGVALENPISLSEGFNDTVQFNLDGDSSTYFSIAQDENSVTLTVRETIPPAVIANNNQLIFVINAQSANGATAQATVVILLPNEVDEDMPVLGFERTSYVGSIENDIVTIQPITLTEGYTEDVVFTLIGDLKSFFAYTRDEATIILRLDDTIPEESIPTNGIIVLGVQASTPTDSLPAVTTIILEVIRDDKSTEVENLVFAQTYYVGTYNATTGVALENPISLSEGFNDTVQFNLDGDSSTYFSIAQDENSVTLTVRETIPPAVIANNNQLIFVINAQSANGATAQATVVILLPNEVDEDMPVLGFERTSYVGSIENDIVTIQPITLTEGYTEDVIFTLIGDLESFFAYTRDEATIILRLDDTIPEESIPTNGIIVLGIQASTPTDSLPAVTTVILEVIRDDKSTEVENLVFAQTYYVGTYNATTGVALENPISLSEGFNDTVQFNLDGDSSTYFSIAQDENSVTLTVRETIPPAVIANNNQLIFVINAQSANGASAQATVVILLPNEVDEDMPVLGFERTSYVGSIENDIVTIQPITLTEGYTEDVVFTLIGDLESFFAYTRDEATIILRLDGTIPEESIPTNGIIVLGVQASTPTDSLPAVTTVVLEVIRDDKSTEVENLVFAQTYYVGTYNATTGVALENPISLSEGFNDTVQFNLDGDSSTYFSIAQDENSVTLTVRETIPPAVIANNNQLIFVINAQSANGATAQATVVILLPNEVDEDMPVLGFERTSYVGSIENDIVTIQPITLTEGYTEDVVFTLIGDLESFFAYTRDEATIILRLDDTIPEESIPTNGIIVLGIQASTPTDSLPAVTTVILEVIRDDKSTEVENLVFAQTYYVGTYNATTGVALENPISLSEGFNDTVQFNLDGDSSTYFSIAQDENSVTLTVRETIPPAVIANNNQLIFVINAQSANGASAQATVVILLPNEVDEDMPVLGFERTSYVGSIENDIVTIQPITLTEGYTEDVVFTLIGDLESFFAYTRDEATIILRLDGTIPEESIPTNGIIVLGVQASTPTDSLPAVTTVVLEVIRDDKSTEVENLVFAQTYYVGTYNATTGVALENPISLSEGFNDTVQFNLDGDSSTYFSIAQDENSVTLTVRETIPPAVIANNNQLIFVINAQSANGATAQATVVILLPNEVDEDMPVLGFERTSYVGSIENDIVTIQPITLTEGYTEDVVFTLIGDLKSFFAYTRDEATIILRLDDTIPEESIPTNGIIVLGVQASTPTDSLPAVTTIILEVIRDDKSTEVENLVFAQTYYVGTYNATTGVALENPISLSEGFNDTVQFNLDGDSSTYFSIAQDENSVTLTVRETIPPAVIANNNQLIFVINAQSANGATAQATVVILLPNEVDEDMPVLGFERTSYVGSIENDIVTIQPITLTEGYTEDVIFTLIGDLESFFAYTRDDATIILRLDDTIPEESIPTNGIIVLGIQASTPTDSLPAVTTVILEVIRDDKSTEVENLVFAQTYYVGTYNATTGVALENPISLSEGFNDTVQFNLDGDSSTYFSIAQDENSVTLTVRETIPPAVIANNNQLIFVINAQSANGASAQATVVILLPNEVDEDMPVLGFERTSYVGSIENDIVTIQPITLTEGYTDDVIFTLIGDFVVFFELSRNGATVNVELENSIPSDVLPENGIIILGIQASLENIIPAVTTVILEIKRSGGSTASFSKVLYEGSLHDQAVQHETITVAGTEETTVDIRGVYEELFKASLSEGVVTVERTGSVTLPSDVTHVAIEIQVGDAAAVLLLQVFHTDTPSPPPSVTFSSPSYVIRADILHTGIIGIVSATADNGESLDYTLDVENAHLAARLAVNSNGELLVSSPVDAGEYFFQVVATTRITQAAGEATVYLSIDVTGITLPPLIVLDRDEEVAHENLVVFNGTDYAGCSFTVTNRFPINHDWLYVDETGLHARVINREDPSIAFMALSQVQVELEVHCNTLARNKRSVRESRLDWLGPYDYGTSTWILGESIAHDPSRSVVNLIVNDINDNPPIFVGKENEPIAVGYPIPELEDVVLPRALVQLEATDADVGENAALVYWSAEPELAVSPSSGSVHVREVVALRHDQPLVVHATDRRGQGLSGAVKLLVKLLDVTEIAVVTVRNAFLEDETNIIANLSESIGHEVRVLRAVVISDDTEDINGLNTRRKRQTNGAGATLQLYVYGLIEREPIAADILIENINSNATGVVSIADTISLEDHLEARQIHSGRDIGLLVATIVLSVLLFILIVAILVWLFLKWRKARKNEEFSDENSLESRNESIVQPEKDDFRPKPRINIDDLKRSERRLQEMIEVPYNEPVIPATSKNESQIESINDISQPDPNILMPIVIKDKLKDAVEDLSDTDEFGEVRLPRRKSVVTFNENVEKIIHVDDNVEGSSISSDVEMFRF
ncbi:uncharacterized protein LOC128670467 isoform X2 [Plodia interpunctella]|uniref:uncharacterized protein LOC128670467 isoform X2 n=1 Tax=Plodia interpunctella TaxID=58824 RepID=UPI002367BC3D|nr:uncharacterized protein LOC128670467 isoform X2 [Plodia interpunctella]